MGMLFETKGREVGFYRPWASKERHDKQLNDLTKANVKRKLWEKLPRYLPSKWTERVSKIKSF